jgi:hypothetical protein
VINDVASARSAAANEIDITAAAANAKLRKNLGIIGLVISCVLPWVRTFAQTTASPQAFTLVARPAHVCCIVPGIRLEMTV